MLYMTQMTKDMTRLTILDLSQMTRDITS